MPSLVQRLKAISEGKIAPPGIMTTLGMKMVRYGKGTATVSIEVDNRFHNPMGTLHGGIITDLADASMGIAMMSTLKDDEGLTTIELKMNFIRPVFKGKLTAESRVLHRGRTIGLVESVVKDDDGKEVARGMATQMVLPSQGRKDFLGAFRGRRRRTSLPLVRR